MAGRTKEEENRSRAYIVYVLAYLSANPEKLKKLGFDSIEDLKIEANFKNLPVVRDEDAFGEKVDSKTLLHAFRQLKGPQRSTLDLIYKQFGIELSYKQFKQKLKESDSDFLPYYEDNIIDSNPLQTENEDSYEIEQQPSTIKPDELTENSQDLQSFGKKGRTFFQTVRKRKIFIFEVLIIAIVIILYTGVHKSWFESPPSVASTEHKKKQYDAVINLYSKFQSDSFVVTILFKDSAYQKYCMPIENISVCTGSAFYTLGSSPQSFSLFVDDYNNHRLPLSPNCGYTFIMSEEDISYDSIKVGDSMEYIGRGAEALVNCEVTNTMPVYFDYDLPTIKMMIQESQNMYLPISIRNELMFFDSLTYNRKSLALCSKDQDYFFIFRTRALILPIIKSGHVYRKTDRVTEALYKSKPLPLYLFHWKIARIKFVMDQWLRDNGVE